MGNEFAKRNCDISSSLNPETFVAQHEINVEFMRLYRYIKGCGNREEAEI
jgi:hypothetical protein